MKTSFSIRNIEINPNLVLAPMSGVTCSALRRLTKELNPKALGYVLTEFVSVEGMTRQSLRSAELMRYRDMERPVAIQIFGYDIDRMRDGAMMVQDSGADIVDINCGCPAPKVVKRGGGAELMRQPEHLAKIFREVRKAVSIPLTMKMRSGWDDNKLNCVEIGQMAESEGVEGITVHGRTRQQLYRGLADWNFVSKVAEKVKIPVCGSGDVNDLTSARERLALPGVAGLYIGRAAMENPYIFSQIMGQETPNLRTDAQAAARILLRYIELLREDFADRVCIGRVKQLGSQMARGHLWRKDLLRAMDLTVQTDILKQVMDASFGSSAAEKPIEADGSVEIAHL